MKTNPEHQTVHVYCKKDLIAAFKMAEHIPGVDNSIGTNVVLHLSPEKEVIYELTPIYTPDLNKVLFQIRSTPADAFEYKPFPKRIRRSLF